MLIDIKRITNIQFRFYIFEFDLFKHLFSVQAVQNYY